MPSYRDDRQKTLGNIYFVWNPHQPLPAGTGGTENYTIGHVRELNRRGIKAHVVTIGVGLTDGRDEFTDIPFVSMASVADVGDLDGVVIFVAEFPVVATRRPAYQMLHVPPPDGDVDRVRIAATMQDRSLIATSRFAAGLWAEFLDVDVDTISIVYPYAELCFSTEVRPPAGDAEIRILYAGRLSPEKGIYTLLAMLDLVPAGRDRSFTCTATTAGADKPQGRNIQRVLEAHPRVRVVPRRTTPRSMATLMARHDIIVMPSNSQYWHETFGIVSIEAQHSGCRVVASDDGGLPETDCGSITLVAPDNPAALARGIRDATALGAVDDLVRINAAARFTVDNSVDGLIDVLLMPSSITPAAVVRDLETLVRLPAADDPRERSTLPTPA
ncbi:glycosyltransferase family 4 protein [Nocardioides sp. NPDC006273]|uniref:glycosyltransferase family 4 protein n=1 Tax=Nocardioides sp. NPDC006273 TaxID=3155598 RepID=UPI0033B52916